MNKRELFAGLMAHAAAAFLTTTGSTGARAAADPAALLRAEGCVVLLRHAQTTAGIGDPTNFRLDQCSTQRNLSDEGKEQSRRIGQWFKARGLTPRSVQTSPWCRCKDTAELAFGKYTELPALGSTFDNSSDQNEQTKVLRTRLGFVPAGQFEVWVTHQVNITALTGESTSMAEAVIINNKAKVLARTMFAG
jgi:phosphohistidine phosphatase SixA